MRASVPQQSRVLIVHNRYRSVMPSGENVVVDADVDLLRSAGHVVETFFRSSDDIDDFGLADRVRLATSPVVAPQVQRELGRVIERFRPEVMHLHNPFPLLSPAVVRTAKRRGVPVVQTVHNFRHVCASGVFFRDGGVCTDCADRTLPWPAAVHGCYRGSRAQSTVMAVALTAHRSTWRQVDRFLPVSDFVGEQLRRQGVAPSAITLMPNAVADPGPPAPLGQGFVFAARLAPEKGVRMLVDAWRLSVASSVTTLTVAGAGPDASLVEAASRTDRGFVAAGHLERGEIAQLMDQAAVVVSPSLWFEGLPMTIIEGFSRGRPVLASDLGAARSMIDESNGWLAAPTVRGLVDAIDSITSTQLEKRAAGARSTFLDRYTPEARLAALTAVYREVATRRA